MKHFLCLLRSDLHPINSVTGLEPPFSGLRDKWGTVEWHFLGAAAVAAAQGDSDVAPGVARWPGWLAVGDVRLDNWSELAHFVQRCDPPRSDLEKAVAILAARGPAGVVDLIGDFAFVAWNDARKTLIAARDAFGVKELHWTRRGDLIAFSSRASLLARDWAIDDEFVADYLVVGSDPAEHRPYRGVVTVPSGCIASLRGGNVVSQEYWSPNSVVLADAARSPADPMAFRDALAQAVLKRLGTNAETWSQLSGGLDSSSVVCMATWLRRHGRVTHGLAGTITMVDSIGEGDELVYAELVAHSCDVRNEQVVDDWMWRDDGQEPPCTESPTLTYPFWARDRACCEVVRAAGGRILLTGQGSDQYLSAPPLHLADLTARGQFREAHRQTLDWARGTRSSYWSTAAKYALAPLLPNRVRRSHPPPLQRVPCWISPSRVRQWELAGRNGAVRLLDGSWGHKLAYAFAYETSHFGRFSGLTLFDEMFDVRHPFLHRPLVEYALRLPWSARIAPHQQKRILRESMRGILPEQVRTRTGKGGVDGRILWSLKRELPLIETLIREPLLADLGWVEPRSLLQELRSTLMGKAHRSLVLLMATLSLETWLRVRTGRWTAPVRAPAGTPLRVQDVVTQQRRYL